MGIIVTKIGQAWSGLTTDIRAFLARHMRAHRTGVYLTVQAAPEGRAEDWSKWGIRGRADGLLHTVRDDFRHRRSGIA
jgi:hypothetical protein